VTTTTDPGGSPAVIYNRSGVTIDTIVGGVSPAEADAVPIVRYGAHTVVLVSSPNGRSDSPVSLPADAEIGDVVEVYGVYTTLVGRVTPYVWPQSGGSIATRPGGAPSSPAAIFRKVTSDDWAMLAGANVF
jgi:hypothetical protein